MHRGHGAWSSNGDLVAGTLEAGAHWSEVEEDDTGLKRPKWRRVLKRPQGFRAILEDDGNKEEKPGAG